MGRYLAILAVTNLFIVFSVYATTFQPVPLGKLLVPANAIVMADFLESQSVLLEDGTVATEAHFRLEKEWGIDAEDYGISEIKVYYPGGIINGKAMTIEGSPRFVEGEKNILLLSQREDGRLWIQGLSMGTFKVVRIGPQSMLINPIFPANPELSQIPLENFLRKVVEVKNVSLKEINSDKYVRELSKDQQRMVVGASRSIASSSNPSGVKHEPNVLDSFWLVTMLGGLGLLAAWKSRRKSR